MKEHLVLLIYPYISTDVDTDPSGYGVDKSAAMRSIEFHKAAFKRTRFDDKCRDEMYKRLDLGLSQWAAP